MPSMLMLRAGAVVAALFIIGLGVYQYGGRQKDAGRAEVQALWDQAAAVAAAAAASASEAARQVEAQRAQAHQEVIDDANKRTQAAQRDAATARAAASRLRAAAANRAAADSGCAPGDPAIAGPGTAASGAGPVLADVLGRIDDVAGILAAHADAAGTAGRACERAYDSLGQ